MRAPKYRAWHTKSGRFAKDGELFLIIDSKNYNLYSVDFDNFRLENDNYILMQSTGLKDKYGIEMFEGDICKVHKFRQGVVGGNCVLVEFEEEMVCVVEKATVEPRIYPLEWFLRDVADDERPTNHWFSSGLNEESYEVIGNIYENPELCKR